LASSGTQRCGSHPSEASPHELVGFHDHPGRRHRQRRHHLRQNPLHASISMKTGSTNLGSPNLKHQRRPCSINPLWRGSSPCTAASRSTWTRRIQPPLLTPPPPSGPDGSPEWRQPDLTPVGLARDADRRARRSPAHRPTDARARRRSSQPRRLSLRRS